MMDPLPDQSWKKQKNFYIRMLASEECFCDREKKHGYAFCYDCYKQLPPEMQKALYQLVGQGFEGAYEDAVKWLSENV